MSKHKTSFDIRIVLRPRSLDDTFDLALAYGRTYVRDLIRPAGAACLFCALPPTAAWLVLGLDLEIALSLTIILSGIAERSITAFAGTHLFRNISNVRNAWLDIAKKLPFICLHTSIALVPFVMFVNVQDRGGWFEFATILCFIWPLGLASYAYLAEVTQLEHLPLRSAFRRTRALTSPRYIRTLMLFLLGVTIRALIIAATYFTIVFVFETVLQFRGISQSATPALLIIGYAVSGPYMALVRFFDYIDARTRREGWDIQVQFNAISQRAREEEARSLAA